MASLSEEFERSVAENSDRVALVDEAGRSWSYGELADEVARLAGRFREIPGIPSASYC